MTQSVLVGKDTIILNSDTVYTGTENPQNDEKLVRKAVGLPVKKQLIYYKNTHDSESSVNVISYKLVEMYNITDRWYTMEITLDDGSKVRIHSSYLAEMQKPSFVADMAAQMAL